MTLYVSDLDGTLLAGDERVPAYSRDVLNALIARGLMFTFASARSLASASRAVEGLRLRLPVILYNGGLIYDLAAKKPLFHTLLETDVKEYIYYVLSTHAIYPMVYAAVDGRERLAYAGYATGEGVKRYCGRRAGDDRLFSAQNWRELLAGQVFYFKCIGAREQLEAVWNDLKYDTRFLCIFHPETYSSDYWLEIFPRNATKAKGVQFVRELLGCSRVVCFGDTSNDSDMFDVCEEKYAVMNADDWLKAKATGVIGYCEEDGVAKWLKAHFRG